MGICENCHNWKVFKERCWFYWKGKTTCSQHKKSWDSEPSFITEEPEVESEIKKLHFVANF
ncbi:MAG: hypothetical protein QXU88_00705 [Candidatus Woesearchaeota archaeon]